MVRSIDKNLPRPRLRAPPPGPLAQTRASTRSRSTLNDVFCFAILTHSIQSTHPQPHRGCITGASKSLAQATLGPFERLRKRLEFAAQGDPSAESSRAVATARLFAAAVSARLSEFAERVAEKASLAPDDESLATTAGYLAASKATWQLCSLIFVEPGDGTGIVSEGLVEWFKENASALNLGENGLPERLRALLSEIATISEENGMGNQSGNDTTAPHVNPEDASQYWSCFTSLVALGWTDAAIDLVGLHSCWDEWRMGKERAKPHAELLEAVVALLRCTPRLKLIDESELAEEEQHGDGLGDADEDLSDIFGGLNTHRRRRDGDDTSNKFTATSAPQFSAFREAWVRQVQRVIDDNALFDTCGDSELAQGCRAALQTMVGEETAIKRAVGANSNWLELFIASARNKFVSLRVAGDCAALLRKCIASQGKSHHSPELDELIISILEADASAVASAVSKHLDAWFLANVAEMLVAAAGGEAWSNEIFSGVALKRPVATLRGASQAELHLVEYGAALATRKCTRDIAMRVFPKCATRGVGACGEVVNSMGATSPGSLFTSFDNAECDEFVNAERTLEACHYAQLPESVASGVVWRASMAARRRGDSNAATAWARRASDARGAFASGFSVDALARERLPSASEAASDPVAAATKIMKLAREHPGVTSGFGHGNGAISLNDRGTGGTSSGAGAFLDALAIFRSRLNELEKVGTQVDASHKSTSDAVAAKQVLSDSTVMKAQRTGDAFSELLTLDSGNLHHLWRHLIFLAIPLLEGTHRSLTKRDVHLSLAKLEHGLTASYGQLDASSVEAEAENSYTRTVGDVRDQAARLALAREYARACV